MSHASSEDPNLLRRRAADLAMEGRHCEAAQLYAAALSSSPNGAVLAFRLGEERRKCGDLAGARDAFLRAAELYDEDGHVTLADATRHMIDDLHAPSPLTTRSRWRRALDRLRRHLRSAR